MDSRPPRPAVLVAGAALAGKSALLEAVGARRDDKDAPFGDRPLGQWWASEDAAFFELTATSFVGARRDRRRWLDAMRERGTGVDALVYAIDVEALLDASDEQTESIVAGLSELARDAAVPAFVAFTHVDRIYGFFETFSPLDDLAARVLGGAIEPRERRSTSVLVKELLDRNLAALYACALHRIQETQAMADREAIYTFPLEMGWVVRRAAKALRSLDREKAPRPRLRGVFFTSARQDDAWRCNVSAAMGRAFGIKGPMQDRKTRVLTPQQARSGSEPMFVLELFEAVLRDCHPRARPPNRRP